MLKFNTCFFVCTLICGCVLARRDYFLLWDFQKWYRNYNDEKEVIGSVS